MSNIDSLLNHDTSLERRPSDTHCADMTTSTTPITTPATTTDDAADALTTLATLGAGQQYAAPHADSALQERMRDGTPTAIISQDVVRDEKCPSPQPPIKHEPSGTPRENTPAIGSAQPDRQNSIAGDDMDNDALKALEIAKQSDLGLRRRNQTAADGVQSPSDLKPVSTKKRPAPASASGIRKKGTAKTSKPNKKRKVETEDGTTRSVTPTSRASKPPPRGFKKSSQSGTPALESSPAPDNSSQVHGSDDDGDSSEDHNLYCLCKKPDNHKWMIGCDGGCDDWFHGDCVNMKQADEELVDRFICPLCEENGRGHTTWKPMCRDPCLCT